MSRRSLDLVARKPQRQQLLRRASSALYPDLATLLSTPSKPEPVKQVELPSVQPRPAPRAHRLRTVRRSVLRSGISWFLLIAVGSTSAIGIATVVQHGRAAQTKVTEQADKAQTDLSAAASALATRDLDAAAASFSDASAAFTSINSQIDHLDTALSTVLTLWPGNPAGSGKSLARAGVHLAAAGSSLVETVRRFDGVDLSTLAPPTIGAPGPVKTASTARTLSQALAEAEPSFGSVVSELSSAADLLKNVNLGILPSSIRTKLEPLLAELPAVRSDLEHLRGLFGTLADLAGANGARRFAFVFQNPNELRPTGGFMGQFALLKVENGRVDRLDLKSIYDASGQVKTHRAAPEGLNVISDKFDLQDANWFPDFATTAQSLRSFFSETGDPPVDGFIALNPAVVNDILAITGPIDLAKLNLRVTEDNFVEEAQYEVPKKDVARETAFFPSFAQAFFARVLTLPRERWPELIGVLLKGVVRKDLQVHLGTDDAERLAQSLGAAGSLPPAGTDGQALVYANIGGGKTDNFVKEQRSLKLTIDGGTVHHELTVTRKDTRTDQYKDKHNRSYVRLYVPAGSRLISADGFDTDIKELVSYGCKDCTPDALLDASSKGEWEPRSNTRSYNEGGWSVFANWVTLAAGEERTIRIAYDTPRSTVQKDGGVELDVWRQPGSSDVPMHVSVNAAGLRYVTGASANGDKADLDLRLDRDQVIGIVAP